MLYNIDVELDTISTTDTETVVWCTNETDNNTTCHRGYSEFGTVRGGLNGLQILLPSKEMRDWNKFAWKKRDILVHKEGNVHIIFEGFDDDTYKTFHGKHYLWEYENSIERYEENDGYMQTSLFSKAKESDAQTYINTIEEKLGGKLNRETLEVEKSQPEFKDGDMVSLEIRYIDNEDVIVETYIVHGDYNYGEELNFHAGCNNLGMIKHNSCVKPTNTSVRKVFIRYATDSEKQQLFDALAKKGKTWDAEKKAIVNLPKKCEFKAFDKVLVRDSNDYKWKAGFFSHYSEGLNYPFICVGGSYGQCIPYNEDTKHLLGTTDEWKGGEG